MTLGELYRVLIEEQPVNIYQGCLPIFKGKAFDIPIKLFDASIKQIITGYNTKRITIELHK